MNQETIKQQAKAKELVKSRIDVKKQIQKYVETLSTKDSDYTSELECLGDFTRKARLLEESDSAFFKNTRMLIDVANGYFYKDTSNEALSSKQGFESLKNDLYRDIYAEIELLSVIKKIERFYESEKI